MIKSETSNRKPKVSICVIAFNQEKYIANCLESLVRQDANFEFEIIVGNDSSTDGTQEIISSFQRMHPEKISWINHEKNIGTVANILAIYRLARGEYICHIDGDDMAAPNKISEQVMALESNPSCHICTHNVHLIDSRNVSLGRTFRKLDSGIYTVEDLVAALPFFAHSSKMFRNDMNEIFWQQLSKDTLDIEVHVQQALLGNIYHINKPLGYYRVLTGVTTHNRNISPHLPEGTRRLYKNLKESNILDDSKISKCYARSFFAFAYQAALLGNNEQAKIYISESLTVCKYTPFQRLFRFATTLMISPFVARMVNYVKCNLGDH